MKQLKLSVVMALVLLMGGPQVGLAQNRYQLPMVPSASSAALEGFIRIVNRSHQAGTVRIHAIDDTGKRFGPVSLSLDAKETVNFRSLELEQGNASKGLPVGVGDGEGHWRLLLDTSLSIGSLAYVRTADGFVTSMHDVTPEAEMCHHVWFFNPGSNTNQRSLLRLVNPGDSAAEVTITGRDDQGTSPPEGGGVSLTLPAGTARMLNAQELESGGGGFSGRIGNGAGKWQLFVSANNSIQVMSLLMSPTGHLTNLSTSPVEMVTPADCEPDVAIQDTPIMISSRCEREVQICARDYDCEDGDEVRVTLNNDVVFEGEIFNEWQCRTAPVNEGENSLVFFAINGTGFKGLCRYIDLNTGELRITGLGGSMNSQRWAHKGGAGSLVKLLITTEQTNNNCSYDPTGSGGIVTTNIMDGCADGYDTDVRFFEFSNRNIVQQWPPDSNRTYVTPVRGRLDGNCTLGNEVCYGARQRRFNPFLYWGVDIDGSEYDSRACERCVANTNITRTLRCSSRNIQDSSAESVAQDVEEGTEAKPKESSRAANSSDPTTRLNEPEILKLGE